MDANAARWASSVGAAARAELPADPVDPAAGSRRCRRPAPRSGGASWFAHSGIVPLAAARPRRQHRHRPASCHRSTSCRSRPAGRERRAPGEIRRARAPVRRSRRRSGSAGTPAGSTRRDRGSRTPSAPTAAARPRRRATGGSSPSTLIRTSRTPSNSLAVNTIWAIASSSAGAGSSSSSVVTSTVTTPAPDRAERSTRSRGRALVTPASSSAALGPLSSSCITAPAVGSTLRSTDVQLRRAVVALVHEVDARRTGRRAARRRERSRTTPGRRAGSPGACGPGSIAQPVTTAITAPPRSQRRARALTLTARRLPPDRPHDRAARARSPAARSRTGPPASPSMRSSTQTRPPWMRTCSSTRASPRPAPSLPARRPAVDAAREALEDQRPLLDRDAGPVVLDGDSDVAERLVGQVGVGDRDLGIAATVGVGVVDEVGEHAGETPAVTADHGALGPLAHRDGRRRGRADGDGVAHELRRPGGPRGGAGSHRRRTG